MKKGIAILLLAIMVFDLFSCTSYKQLSTQQDYEFYQFKDHIQVVEIHSKKDSIISFNEKFPGKLTNKTVYGLHQMRFPYNTFDSIIFTSQSQNSAFIRDRGKLYKVISQDRTGFICISSDTIRTPFSEITQMKVKRRDPVKTTLLVTGIGAVIIGVSVYLVNHMTFDAGLGGI